MQTHTWTFLTRLDLTSGVSIVIKDPDLWMTAPLPTPMRSASALLKKTSDFIRKR